MAAIQATAIAQTKDHGLELSWENKLAQGGAFTAFFAYHKNWMVRRHELFQPEVFSHLHAFFCHGPAHFTKRNLFRRAVDHFAESLGPRE